MVRPLIGIAGGKQNGKDSIGKFLVERYGYTRHAFADALKSKAAEALVDPESGYDSFAIYNYLEDHKNDGPNDRGGWVRPFLQTFGMAHRDMYDQDYWSKEVPLSPGTVITDVRFPDEVLAIKRQHGIVWRVTRPSHISTDAHASEAHGASLDADVDILNDGSIEDLHAKVALLMEALV